MTDNWPENGRILQTRLWFHWGEASITALSLSVCCGPGVSRKAQSNLGNSSTGRLSLPLLSLNFCPLIPENHILHLFMAVKHFTWSGKIELYIEEQVKSIDITTHTQMAKLKKKWRLSNVKMSCNPNAHLLRTTSALKVWLFFGKIDLFYDTTMLLVNPYLKKYKHMSIKWLIKNVQSHYLLFILAPNRK